MTQIIKKKSQGIACLVIVAVSGIASKCGNAFIDWKSGKSKGATQHKSITKQGIVNWSEEFRIPLTIFHKKRTQSFEKIIVSLRLFIQPKISKTKCIGTVKFNLIEYIASPEPIFPDFPISIKSQLKHKNQPKLLICLKIYPDFNLRNIPSLMKLPEIQEKIQQYINNLNLNELNSSDEEYSEVISTAEQDNENKKDIFNQDDYSDFIDVLRPDHQIIDEDLEWEDVLQPFKMQKDGISKQNNDLIQKINNLSSQEENLSDSQRNEIKQKQQERQIQLKKEYLAKHQKNRIFQKQELERKKKQKEIEKQQLERKKKEELRNRKLQLRTISIKKMEVEQFWQETSKKENENMKSQLIIIHNQNQEILSLEKQISTIKIILHAKSLIQSLLYFQTNLFDKERPLPSCLFYKFLVYWQVFDPKKNINSHLIASEFIDSLKKFILTNQRNTPILIWSLSNTIFLNSILMKQFSLPNLSSTEITTLILNKKTKTKKKEEKSKAKPQEEIEKYLQKKLYLLISQSLIFIIENVQKELKPLLVSAFLEQYQPSKVKISTRTPIHIIEKFFNLLQDNKIKSDIILLIFRQIFCYINRVLFNSLLQRNELCTISNCFQIRLALLDLSTWLTKANLEKIDIELSQIFEGAKLITIKQIILSDSETNKVNLQESFPSLKASDISTLLSNFTPDRFDPNPFPLEKLKRMQLENQTEKPHLVDYLRYDIRFMFSSEIDLLQYPTKNWNLILLPKNIFFTQDLTYLGQQKD
eukprot:Anaeramoba_ignava/a217484_38.p1 GENE.a217484_38~~a217484_38.p1  ORF type:complete len:757 (-),score=256.75 a217484_38:133-2403(-)